MSDVLHCMPCSGTGIAIPTPEECRAQFIKDGNLGHVHVAHRFVAEPPAPVATTVLFQPYVYVERDGTIRIDWTDCMVCSQDAEGTDVYDDDVQAEASYHLDAVLGLPVDEETPAAHAAVLRRLADHLDAQP